MPIFISYSHSDIKFVDSLSLNLVSKGVHIWVDRWELNVGDSIITKIQDAIQNSSALLVILSKSSVESEWCKKELHSGLIRELEEKKVILLPLLIDDCTIPLFLRDKLYADFRTNFDSGLQTVLQSIAKVTSTVRSRIVQTEFHIDWAIDWRETENNLELRITVIEQAKQYPFSVLTEVVIIANRQATLRYKETCKLGLEWFGRSTILGLLLEYLQTKDVKILLVDQFAKNLKLHVKDKHSKKALKVMITSRWLGEDTGRDLVVNISNQLLIIREYILKADRPLTAEELRKLNII